MIKYFILSIIYILLLTNNSFCICQGMASGFGYKDNPLPSPVVNIGRNTAGNRYRYSSVNSLVFEVIPDESGSDACPGIPASITGIVSQNACGSKAVWVDSARYSKYDSSSEIRTCASQCGFGVYETCITLSSQGNAITSIFGGDQSKLWAKEVYFSGSNTGFNPAVATDDHRYGHRVGYVYNLYSAACPYSTEKLDVDECLARQRSFSGEMGDYYKGVKYNKNNNCYELVKNKAFSCQDSGTCKCVNDDLHGNCSTSSDYLPDKNSTYWISLKADVKSCFLCYAGIRSLLNSCVNASYDKGYGYGQNNTYSKKFQVLMTALNENPNSNNISKYNVFAGLYGPGLYICAYETPEFNIGKLAASVALVAFTGGVGVVFAAPIMTADALLKSQESGDQLSRVGCKKIQTKSGPRPFPRIARPAPSDAKVNGKLAFFVFPATNLFVMSPRVKKFNDIAINGSCDGQLEVGEIVRGDFYNPSLIIRYGLNNTAIWFNPTNNSTFVSKYTTTQTKSFSGNQYSDTGKGKEKISEWSTFNVNEARPVVVSYGMPNETGGSCTFDVSTDLALQDRICARIEYDDSRQKDFFVAYIVKNKDTPNKNCSQLFEDGDLSLLGGVPRPPLKYDYDTNSNKTVTQIAMSEPVATDRSSQILISLKPLPSGGYMQQNGTIASFYKSDGGYTDAAYAIMSKVKLLTFTSLSLSADATTSSQSISDDNNCAYILNHKICIGPFLGFDCQALNANTENPIRESIRLKRITSCATSDTKCQKELDLFNRIYSKCIKLKRCPVSSSEDQDGCAMNGAMKMKIYTTDPDDLRVNYTTSDYYYNYNWSDGICIVSGISQVEFGDHGTHVPEYEDYGNLTVANDSVVTFLTNLDSIKISARTTGSFTDTGAENIITPNNSFFAESNPANARLSLYNSLGSSLVAQYFGSSIRSSEDLVNKISVRRKNLDDMGLCVVFDRVNEIQYGDGGGNYKDGNKYNFYVPYKCDYLEAQTLGAGGKSEQWNQDARVEYGGRSAGECVGWALACTMGICIWSCIFDGCDECDKCLDKVHNLCTRYLQSGSGSGGGYAHAILDMSKIDRDVLIIQPGVDNARDADFEYADSDELPDVKELLTKDTNRLIRPVFGSDSVIWKTSPSWNSGNGGSSDLNAYAEINSAIINGNGGMHKPYDDRGTVGRGGHYDENYIVPSGYGACSNASIAPVMPAEPAKDSASSTSSGKNQAYYDNKYPVIKAAENNCRNNTCCKKTDKDIYDETVCLKPCTLSQYLGIPDVISNTGFCDDCTQAIGRCCKIKGCVDEANRLYEQLLIAIPSYTAMDMDPAYVNESKQYPLYYLWLSYNPLFPCERIGLSRPISYDSQPTCFNPNERTFIQVENYMLTVQNKINGVCTRMYTQADVDYCKALYPAIYCCQDAVCIKQKSDRKAEMKANNTGMTTDEYDEAKEKYDIDLKNYKNAKIAYNAEIESNFMNTFYTNMCPVTVAGEDGEYDYPGTGQEVLFNGGGNIAIKALNYVNNNCINSTDDNCIRYRMTKNYCAQTKIDWLNIEYEDSERDGWNRGTSRNDALIKNPFRGSGGCARDHKVDDTLVGSAYEDNDGIVDKEAWGGSGWIRLAIPYVISNSVSDVSDDHKVLNKQRGMRDLSCVPRCPRAFIKIQQKVCEYSNGDPTRGYETAVNGNVSPLKCFDSNGNISIPTSGFGRTCLFTQCGDDYKKNYRYNGFCGESINIYRSNLFISGAGFYTDLASANETLQYCGVLANSANSGLYTLDSTLSGNEYLMTCDDHGNWRLSSDTTIKATYACPTIKPSFFNNINIIQSLDRTQIPQTDEFNHIPNSSTYCGGYGLFKPMT